MESGLDKNVTMNKKNPKISIITVVLNAQNTIEETIKSVLNQTSNNIEYIIIDGKSTDNTLAIIKKYYLQIDTIVSENDSGIYDGMNKAVQMAKGEWIFFLNADDRLYDNEVINKVFHVIIKNKTADIIYGDILKYYRNSKTKKIGENLNITNLRKAIAPPHQGMFVKKDLLTVFPFDISYRSSSDFNFFCQAIINKTKAHRINEIISHFSDGGMSSNKSISYKETSEIIRKHFGVYYYWVFYIKKIMIEQGIKKIIAKMFK